MGIRYRMGFTHVPKLPVPKANVNGPTPQGIERKRSLLHCKKEHICNQQAPYTKKGETTRLILTLRGVGLIVRALRDTQTDRIARVR